MKTKEVFLIIINGQAVKCFWPAKSATWPQSNEALHMLEDQTEGKKPPKQAWSKDESSAGLAEQLSKEDSECVCWCLVCIQLIIKDLHANSKYKDLWFIIGWTFVI